MKLSKAQLEFIKSERARLDARAKDLDSFGKDLYKSATLSADRSKINFDRWFFNHIIKLHNIEVEAEKASFEDLKNQVEEEFKDGFVK